ncbi:hypothetical protein FGG78_36515 [Thioclava sp. BHET1]|nr:hypothetical protein FGG78_36515 [Thioclava sp. BHET1]
MQPELRSRRRVLGLALQRYSEADRDWRSALLEMKRWFPASSALYHDAIGDPGSRLRNLHDARTKALLRFETAHVKFVTARARAARRAARGAAHLLILSYGQQLH